MILPGDEWKEEQVLTPTTSDILKYHATGARLLMDMQFSYRGPTEVVISAVANNGELFKAGTGDQYRPDEWYKTKDVQIIAVLPTVPEAAPPPAGKRQEPRPAPPRRKWTWRAKWETVKWLIRE